MKKKIKVKRILALLSLIFLFLFFYFGCIKSKMSNQDNIEQLHVNSQCYYIRVNDYKIEVMNSDKKIVEEYKLKKDEGHILSHYIDDIDNDNTDEILIVTGENREDYGKYIIFLRYENKLDKIYKKDIGKLSPWKIQTSDVDGDGRKEISIGVYKKSEFHPIMAKRPFIYEWTGKDIFPKWRGSRLSRPFEDYSFLDIDKDGKDELISIEILKNGNKIINSYKWKGFGFEGFKESKEYEDITDIEKGYINHTLSVKIKDGGEYNRFIIMYKDGKISLED